MKYIKLFEEKLEYYNIMTMSSGEIIEELSKEIEKENHDIEYIKEIIYYGHFNINSMWFDNENSDWNLLLWASYLGKEDVIEILLDNNADPNIRDIDGRTPLMVATSNAKINVIKLLFNNPKTDVNISDRWGDTALIRAVDNGNKKVINTLLQNPNIDINIQNKDGESALFFAVRYKDEYAIEELLKQPDIDINVTNIEGKGIQDIADDSIKSKYFI